MIEFSPRDPFPLSVWDDVNEASRKRHATLVDQWLGLNITEIEKELARAGSLFRPHQDSTTESRETQRLWFGLAPEDLQTPYLEIRNLLNELAPRAGETVVDLGAAYGRMGHVLHRHHPGVKFIGYEFVGERCFEGRKAFARHDMSAARLEHVDLSLKSFTPTVAEYYFIYDFGNEKAIEKILFDLKRISQTSEIKLIARGRSCRYLIENRHSWLKRVPGPERRATMYRTEASAFRLLDKTSAV
jgi:hypothetical protein